MDMALTEILCIAGFAVFVIIMDNGNWERKKQ